MRYSFVLFGLAAVALANLNQNVNERSDVQCCTGKFGRCVCYADQPCCAKTRPDPHGTPDLPNGGKLGPGYLGN
ncbi:hypothetical protein E4U49_005422 [Claviceps purpurea]|nr:hypothetical protein E4U49_005422 [Claviceps purpurea]